MDLCILKYRRCRNQVSIWQRLADVVSVTEFHRIYITSISAPISARHNVADIKTIPKWHCHVGSANINVRNLCDEHAHNCTGLSPVWHHAITWNNPVLLSLEPSGTNISEIRIKYKAFHLCKCAEKCSLRHADHFSSGRSVKQERDFNKLSFNWLFQRNALKKQIWHMHDIGFYAL